MGLSDKLRIKIQSLGAEVVGSLSKGWLIFSTSVAADWHLLPLWRRYIAVGAAAGLFLGGSTAMTMAVAQTRNLVQVFTNGTFQGTVPANPEILSDMRRTAAAFRIPLQLIPIHTQLSAGYDWQTVAALPVSAAAIMLDGHPLVYTQDLETAKRVLQRVKQRLTPSNLQGASAHFVGVVHTSAVTVGVAKILTEYEAVQFLMQPPAVGLSGRAMSFTALQSREGSVMLTSLPAPTNGDGVPRLTETLQPLLTVAALAKVQRTVTIPYPTKTEKDPHLSQGVVRVVKPGRPGKAVQQVEEKFINNRLVVQRVLQQTLFRQPVAEVVEQGTNTGVASGVWLWPVDSHFITSGFGWRMLGGVPNFHPGVDIGCALDTPVYATNNGVIEEAGWNSGGYGIWVRMSNGNGVESIFGHLSRVVVHPGQRVAKGDLLGYSGETGFATGPHLHYEVRINGTAVNPVAYM